MGKIDSGLKFLAEQRTTTLRKLTDEVMFAVEAETGSKPVATVLVEFEGDLAAIEAAGFRTRSVAGDVATGEIDIDKVDAVAALDGVRRLEASRVLARELDAALPESRANLVHTGPPGHRGTGVIIGLIDSGIDYTHGAFRRNDGKSRILAIWDQGLTPQGSESSPATFSYGVEYRQPAIDAAIAASNPLTVVRHQDSEAAGFHGTHVAGIAAGDGSPPDPGDDSSPARPAFTFIGVAPEADIVVVANNRGRAAGERGLGDSADTLDAVRYIFDIAASLGRPVVINQSQGDNVGPHDGTSLLERGIDNLLGGPGRAMVKSAGNEGARNRHASGTVTAGVGQNVAFAVPSDQRSPVTVDIWYRGADRLDFSITPPGGAASAVVTPGNSTTLTLPNGNSVFVDSDLNDPGNGDNRIFLVISRGTAATVQSGQWAGTLRGTSVTLGQWDAWIQRNAFAQFLPPLVNAARTISVPGTSREIITAGSYVTKGAGVGSISSFSSRGPTRDGRQAPTVAAPGETLRAPLPGNAYAGNMGTSMASPMVAGAVALLLQRNPALTQADVRQCLMSSARSDAFTGTTPNNAWGAGKLDAQAAFRCVAGPVRTLAPPCGPVRTIAPPCGPVRTIAPPCDQLLTLAPPCPVTVAPPCPITIAPPCVKLRTFAPPCPPLRTLVPPCPITIAPPCPPRTVAPPCQVVTVGPPCVPVTIGPGCGQPPLPGPGESSGGWASMESDWYQDPYGQDWSDQGGTQSVCPCCGRPNADAPGGSGEQPSTQDDDMTRDWYGNPGY
ncbi:MAG: S8 family serine peptidase [Saccharothrix sp.]|nr:S8 family serine peptidase [Saccharothrix sp.]